VLRFPGGDAVHILLDSRASGRTLAVLDCTHVPGPSDRHSHADAQKAVIVLAGRYLFRIDDSEIEAGPGQLVSIRRGVPHDFVVGPHGGRALFVFSPGGVEEYFRALAILAESGPSPVSVAELRRRHHIEPVDGSAPLDT
jgi:hypothetical protein